MHPATTWDIARQRIEEARASAARWRLAAGVRPLRSEPSPLRVALGAGIARLGIVIAGGRTAALGGCREA